MYTYNRNDLQMIKEKRTGGKACDNIKHCRDENINMANLQIQPVVKPSANLINIPR
jgi:starvation-inducible outer membrane lipoprotein